MFFAEIMRILKKQYTAPAESSKATPWETVIFTALTARSRDDQVEPVFRKLMAAYPTPLLLADAEFFAVANILKTIGLYRSKAKNIIALAKALMKNHGGVVPETLDALIALPAVGRKTASCVLVYAFGKPAVAVDTHVYRIVNRLGWVREKTPEKTERALRTILPKRYWFDINRVMVQFGRDICVPRVPKCWRCPVNNFCAFPQKTPKKKDIPPEADPPLAEK